MYGLSEVIREYDKDDLVKKAICNIIMGNLTKEISLSVLADDLQERMYDYIEEDEDLSIDDGSNVRISFTEAILDILNEYFK